MLVHTPYFSVILLYVLSTLYKLIWRSLLDRRTVPVPILHHLRVCCYTDTGSMYVSGKLPTYPSPKLTLTLTSRFGKNVRFGKGLWGVAQKHSLIPDMQPSPNTPAQLMKASSVIQNINGNSFPNCDLSQTKLSVTLESKAVKTLTSSFLLYFTTPP